MTVKTELQHMGEFLVSEGEGTISREKATLAAGNVLKDGMVVALSSGKLVPSHGASGEDVVGISYGNYDATAADLPDVPYIARLAEVDQSLVVAAEASGAVVAWAALKALFIIPR